MKPITFSRPMVLARRAGRKTQTRRLLQFLPGCCHDVREHTDGRLWPHWIRDGDEQAQPCPYGQPGDRLWVREDFQFVSQPMDPVIVRYLADGAEAEAKLTEHEFTLWTKRQFPYRKTPGRFMYQSLARDKPTLLAVRVERLQDITDEDAIAEGCEMESPESVFPKLQPSPDGKGWIGWDDAREWFQHVWTTIHGPVSWDDNPYVWVLTLTPFTNVPLASGQRTPPTAGATPAAL